MQSEGRDGFLSLGSRKANTIQKDHLCQMIENVKARMHSKCKPADNCTKCRRNSQLFLAAGELLLLKSISVDPLCFLSLYSRKAVIVHPPFYCTKSSQVAIMMQSLLRHLTAPLDTFAGPEGAQAFRRECSLEISESPFHA